MLITCRYRGFSHDPTMITRHEMSKPVKSVSVHPNGEKFVYGSEEDSDIHICDAMSGKEQGKWVVDHTTFEEVITF